MAKTEAKPDAQIDQDELKSLAFEIFRERVKFAANEKQYEYIAHQCYEAADRFLRTTAKIESGQLRIATEPPLEPQFVEVPMFRQTTNEKWLPIRNVTTGEIMTERAPVDHFAYAPNLPADHPVNLRFKPLDGISVEERIAAHKAECERKKRELAENERKYRLAVEGN